MLFSPPPSAEALTRIHQHWAETMEDPRNREVTTRAFLGIKIVTTRPTNPFKVFMAGAGKHIKIPDKPSFLQKALAFLLLQGCVAEFACREKQYIGYAYRWCNAKDIFSW